MVIKRPNHADLELVKMVVMAIPMPKERLTIFPIFTFLLIIMLARQNGHTRFSQRPA